MSDNDIILQQFRIGKDKLLAMPDNERNLLFMLGHIGNEISMLQKLQWYASNFQYPANTAAEGHAHTSQSLMIGKILIGKLNESWNFIRSIFLSTELGKEYTPRLDKKGEESLNSLKSYFGKSALLSDIRNNFSFHYFTEGWSENLTAIFNKIDEGECDFYISEKRGNTHWYGAEVVVNYALLKMVEPDNPVEAMDRLMEESLDVAAWIMDFVDHCIVAIIEHHLGSKFVSENLKSVAIANPPDPRDVSIPFFIQTPNEL